MDLRITNTCNNNCLYCLEESLRKKEKYIKKEKLYKVIKEDIKKNNITFYWGNPLLHPDISKIISYCQKSWFKNIWLLTNTFSLNKIFLENLKNKWLKSIWFYFNSFDFKKHKLITNNWIKLKDLIENINIIKKSWLFYKSIIHINKQNIDSISKDIIILNSKFWVKNFEFINYFPFDKPYKNKEFLEYNTIKNKNNINRLFLLIKKLKINVNFVKFSKDFFWDFIEYYNYKRGILNQIWEEDIPVLKSKEIPFCFKEKRCQGCFLKDNCKFYGL